MHIPNSKKIVPHRSIRSWVSWPCLCVTGPVKSRPVIRAVEEPRPIPDDRQGRVHHAPEELELSARSLRPGHGARQHRRGHGPQGHQKQPQLARHSQPRRVQLHREQDNRETVWGDFFLSICSGESFSGFCFKLGPIFSNNAKSGTEFGARFCIFWEKTVPFFKREPLKNSPKDPL